MACTALTLSRRIVPQKKISIQRMNFMGDKYTASGSAPDPNSCPHPLNPPETVSDISRLTLV
jgi:hypothetical protein